MIVNDPKQDLNVVIIGYGLAGETFHAPLIAATKGLKVAAIVTSNPERQDKAKGEFPQAEIVASAEDIWQQASKYDLVVIASPNATHAPLARAAMESGLSVVVDKPLALSVKEAEELIKVSERTGKLLTVFQNRRWDNDFLTVKKIIDEDLLGSITRFESRFERYRAQIRPQAWREAGSVEDGGGLLFDLGSHLIDQALVLFGEPERVYAEMFERRAGARVDDDTFVAITFKNGVVAHLWMSLVARIHGMRMKLRGMKGTYEKFGLDPQEDALRAGLRPGDPNWGMVAKDKWGRVVTDVDGLTVEGVIEMPPGSYEAFYSLLRDAIISGGKPPVDPRDAVRTLKVIELAVRSAKSNEALVCSV